jgi:dTDP-4-dehydrorhamnose reductase
VGASTVLLPFAFCLLPFALVFFLPPRRFAIPPGGCRLVSARIAITGASGMLGRELARVLAARQPLLWDRAACDITDAAATRRVIEQARPDVVIHLAAYTKVNDCQRHPDLAMTVNSRGVRHVAEAVNAVGARLVYISTDYVFDGRKRTPYREDDPVSPVNAYGRSKAAGEGNTALVAGSLILRCGWLFGPGGRNFVEAIRDQIRQGKQLRVVSDQVGTPIWTGHLAPTIVALVDAQISGVVHAAASGQCSWHEFAEAIVELSGLNVAVEAIATPPGDTPRPPYSVLSDARLCALGLGPLPHWREGLREYLRTTRI